MAPTAAYGSPVPRQINTIQPSRQSTQPVPTGLHLALVGEFPTLNLSEFGRIMETALATAAERRNKPIVGFTFMVKVDD